MKVPNNVRYHMIVNLFFFVQHGSYGDHMVLESIGAYESYNMIKGRFKHHADSSDDNYHMMQ